MTNLLKADFRRILKDKMLIVMGILAVAFAAITPLLYTIILSSPDIAENELTASLISNMITGKSQFFSSFSLGNNLGLIAPVLLAIVLCKDFSYGTIRNKIIAGKSRSQIYLSLFITCSVVLIGVMLLHAFITLGISLLFFEYQSTAFTVSDFWYFLASLGFEILVLLFVSSLLSWLCSGMKNVGIAIVIYIAIAFFLIMAGSITQMLLATIGAVDIGEDIVNLLRFVDRINVVNSVAYIGMGSEYVLKDALYLTIPACLGILGFTGLGLWRFNQKDLK